MQSRRPGVSPLAIVLPHPQLPSRRSSLLSAGSDSHSQPRTPVTGLSPNCSAIFFAPSRKSTDSWNSSNADELEWEWKPEQVLLLSRTLDALPAHLVTPFNGPIPPPNLLDKIARGVSKAKGPVDWPHSLRATRVKLIELARAKAKEEALADQRRQVITEEPEVEIDDGSNYSYLHDGTERPLTVEARRRPYRQSSMDFIQPVGTDLKDNDSIARLSRRLQRTDCTFPNPAFHPYARASRAHPNRRSTSPPPLANMPSLINPSTESSDTVNSLSTFSSEPRAIRRSLSSLSSISMLSGSSSGIAIPDPRVQRIRRSESISVGAPKSSVGLKRAPTYGALAQGARREHMASPGRHVRRDSGSYPSSDEEEKARAKQAKKARTKSVTQTALSNPPSSPVAQRPSSPLPPPVPEKDRKHLRSPRKGLIQDENDKVTSSPSPSKHKKTAKVDGSLEKPTNRKRPAPMNLQRNPSIFGPELPHLQKHSPKKTHIATPLSPAKPRGSILTPTKARSPSPSPLSPSSTMALSPAAHIVPSSPSPPATQKAKTLRRVQRLIPARRISFGSLLSGNEEVNTPGEGEGLRNCLGSAFQLL